MGRGRAKPRGRRATAASSEGGKAGGDPMTHDELAWKFADVFQELGVDEINEVLAKNVPLETLDFFAHYGEDFGRAEGIQGDTRRKLPNLLLMGYLLRVLEERLIEGDEFDG
jgi:hypothetical protein